MDATMEGIKIETVEMHSGGQIVRIVKSGLPEIRGATVVEKMIYMQKHLGYFKKIINDEPRGHANVIGAIIVEPDIPEADFGLVVINATGYFAMCGDATLSTSRYAVDSGMVKNVTSPETKMIIQCPCGPLEVSVEYLNGKAGAARFSSVPVFLYKKDLEIHVEGFGSITVDISYGGSFYAILPASRLGLELGNSTYAELDMAATTVTETLREQFKITHFATLELNYLTGTVLTDDDGGKCSAESAHVVFFGDAMIARAPCGSGSTAQMAQLFGRGHVKPGDIRSFRAPSGAIYKATLLRVVKTGSQEAVVIEISGRGYYIGSSTFTLEADDKIGRGFLLK